MESFDVMLENLYTNLELKKNNYKIILPDPILIKSGHKTIWKNVKEFLKLFNRHPDNFINYINNETTIMAYWVSDSKSDGCIFQTKTKKDYIYELMKKYIKDKLLCKSCQSIDTYIIKDKELRKYNFICNNCKNNYIL
jgi:hypothetical protein